MAFDLEKLFLDVFAPQRGDIVTVTHDEPHDTVDDNDSWRERREMAKEWREQLAAIAPRLGITVTPAVTYPATGAANSDLPAEGRLGAEPIALEAAYASATILISMTEFSASAPLIGLAKRHRTMRIASMPWVCRSMENTALAADYAAIASECERLAPHFERADAVEVTFSTGHSCLFDLSDRNSVFKDTGQLHPNPESEIIIGNLPAGEVCVCPNESRDSKTQGEIPAVVDGEQIVYVAKHNHIIDISGDGPVANRERSRFEDEPALGNIAEVAIGCNDSAVVTGNILEDEKAGFHWAYGRSDHLEGTVGVAAFSSPSAVEHIDTVYAVGSPIVCSRFDFISPDGTRTTAILDGKRQL